MNCLDNGPELIVTAPWRPGDHLVIEATPTRHSGGQAATVTVRVLVCPHPRHPCQAYDPTSSPQAHRTSRGQRRSNPRHPCRPRRSTSRNSALCHRRPHRQGPAISGLSRRCTPLGGTGTPSGCCCQGRKRHGSGDTSGGRARRRRPTRRPCPRLPSLRWSDQRRYAIVARPAVVSLPLATRSQQIVSHTGLWYAHCVAQRHRGAPGFPHRYRYRIPHPTGRF